MKILFRNIHRNKVSFSLYIENFNHMGHTILYVSAAAPADMIQPFIFLNFEL